MEDKERRSHRRVEWRGLVRLVVPHADPVEATISDMSEAGCGLRTARAVEPGAEVGIDGSGVYGSGVIRYCYPHHGAFRIGVELRPAR